LSGLTLPVESRQKWTSMEDWVARDSLKAVSRDRLRALSAKSNARGALQTASFLVALTLTTVCLLEAGTLPLFAVALAFVGQGVLLNCLYAGQHELSHWTVFRAKWANDRLGELFGLLTLNPFHTDRWAHFAHHRETQNPLRDSELVGMEPFTTTTYLINLVGIDFWRRRVLTIVLAAAGRGLERDYWLSAEQRRFAVVEARAQVAIWIAVTATSLATGSLLAVTLWIGPLLLFKGFHQLQNTGEHVGMPYDPNIYLNTRTLRGPIWMRWLMWNMGWHTAHHAFPGVPFHALPALHREIEAGLGRPVIVRGYLEAQREIFAGLAVERAVRRAAL
jgi:fatty acid desaturase